MNRNSKIYSLRRYLQKTATKFFGFRIMTRLYYFVILKRFCHLNNPKTLNEKICWLKVNDYWNNSLVISCTDKYRVRSYIETKVGLKYLVPLLAAYDSVEDIDFDVLPDKFVLKCNHGCGYNIIVESKRELNFDETKSKLRKWMSEDFGLFNAEPHYSYIQPKIVCEHHVGQNFKDCKFFCIHGCVEFYYVSEDLLDRTKARMCYYLPNGDKASFHRDNYEVGDFNLPPNVVSEMIGLSEKLASDFVFVRVDFMLTEDNKIFFSELTFCPDGGYLEWTPSNYLLEYGKKLHLNKSNQL